MAGNTFWEIAMMSQHPNLLRCMRGMQAFNEDDFDTVNRIFSKDVVYRIAGRSPIAGEYVGILQLDKLLKIVKEMSGGTMAIDPQVVLADDHSVMMYAHVTAQREGKMLDIDNAYLYRFDDTGKIIEGRTIPVDLYAFDAFWS